ncbi:uncharacterized protein LOC143136004 isoform X1 [Alosa pseudoharengus]|uniref:uncharacterized protein LOC143136004 isoform X1 n=1 Tax=Alosa pseudoharengus TaxID=34774 RepID=UPI003F8B5F9E
MDLGLSFSSGGNVTETRQLDQLSVMVKEEDIKEEEYGHMISCPDEDEKPFAELHCKTETDVTESNVTCNETQQTTAEIEVKIEDDEQELDYLLGKKFEWDNLWSVGNKDLGHSFSSGCNVTDTRQLDQLSVMVKEDIKEEEYGHMISCQDEDEKPFAELHCKTETDGVESNVSYTETQQTTAEVKIEDDDEQEHDYLLESVSEYPDAAQQKIHGQSDELNLQLKGRLHNCTVCKRSFTALTELEKHQQKHSVSVNEQQNTDGKIRHKCIECGKSYSSFWCLKTHMLIHTGEKPHKCNQCEKAFSQSASLKSHMRIHTGEKPYKCVHCGKAFSSSSNLRSHMISHTGEKPHKCDQCGKPFSQRSALKFHMLIHTGEKPHLCAQCGKAFSLISHLKRHILIHTGEKAHKCNQCGKAFSQIADLKSHMRIHTGEKPYKCVHCGKAFSSSSTLKTHMLIHTGEKPHLCVQCGKAFSLIAPLKRHILTHTGEKAHKCSQCGKAFAVFASLKSHMRIHTGEKPYKCVHCGKAFSQSLSLKNHMIYTGEKPYKCIQSRKAC